MVLTQKTLEKLREMINERTEYRAGPKLVQFFNQFGFRDTYGQGFPSRWLFADERLGQINGTPALDECIKAVFSPANFIERIQELDAHIEEFNQYLAFDKWRVVRDGADISFKKLDKVDLNAPQKAESEFLRREFTDVSVQGSGWKTR